MRGLIFTRFFSIVFALILLGGAALAQGTAGNITGVVTDATDAVVSNAMVTLLNPISGHTQTAQTDAAGQFHFNNLPFNRYHISVEMRGFQTGTQDAVIRTAATTTVNFKLVIASSDEVISVKAEADDMVSGDPVSATAVDRNLFSRLPTESMAAPLSSLVTLSTPGIASDSNGLFHPMGEHADTTYSIDGQPVSDQQSRVFGNQLSVNAIQSINVVNGIAPPEYGDKASLVVQTTTRSGLGQSHPTGTLSFDYGSFGTTNGSVAVGFGTPRFGNFVTFDAVDSGRYLDTPEISRCMRMATTKISSTASTIDLTDADSLQLNLGLSRSWFQNPNQYDQQAAGQDQRGQIFSV